MKATAEIVESLKENWIPDIYKDRVRAQRTRLYEIGATPREHRVEIMQTLLGVELKIGNRRLSCPDLSTARYIRVFARIGSREIAIPYDISQISVIADELESAWQIMLALLQNQNRDSSPQVRGKVRAGIIRLIRKEITEIGAGEKMPNF